jgi:hypothetical protein
VDGEHAGDVVGGMGVEDGLGAADPLLGGLEDDL